MSYSSTAAAAAASHIGVWKQKHEPTDGPTDRPLASGEPSTVRVCPPLGGFSLLFESSMFIWLYRCCCYSYRPVPPLPTAPSAKLLCSKLYTTYSDRAARSRVIAAEAPLKNALNQTCGIFPPPCFASLEPTFACLPFPLPDVGEAYVVTAPRTVQCPC